MIGCRTRFCLPPQLEQPMVDAISRRAFLTSAVSITAASYLHGEYLSAATMPSPIGSGWQNEAIENLVQSPHAKLHQVPIRAVTIKSGFWGRRRQVNVAKSIPTMHVLLEANGRMNNYRRLVAKSSAPIPTFTNGQRQSALHCNLVSCLSFGKCRRRLSMTSLPCNNRTDI